DRTVTFLLQLLLVHLLRGLGRLTLRGIVGIDAGAILRTDVVPLAHALRRVVVFPERLQQRLVGNLLRIVDDQHHLVVAGAARADFLIGRIWRHAAGIADGGDINAVTQFPELALGAPEAAETEHRLLEALGIGPLERVVIDEMLVGGADRGSAARQRLARGRHGNFLEAEHAWFSCKALLVLVQSLALIYVAGWPTETAGAITTWKVGVSDCRPGPERPPLGPRVADQRLLLAPEQKEDDAEPAQQTPAWG